MESLRWYYAGTFINVWAIFAIFSQCQVTVSARKLVGTSITKYLCDVIRIIYEYDVGTGKRSFFHNISIFEVFFHSKFVQLIQIVLPCHHENEYKFKFHSEFEEEEIQNSTTVFDLHTNDWKILIECTNSSDSFWPRNIFVFFGNNRW